MWVSASCGLGPGWDRETGQSLLNIGSSSGLCFLLIVIEAAESRLPCHDSRHLWNHEHNEFFLLYVRYLVLAIKSELIHLLWTPEFLNTTNKRGHSSEEAANTQSGKWVQSVQEVLGLKENRTQGRSASSNSQCCQQD